jgi:glycosyltransferase involved in cell wall biosynthesis
MGAGLFPVWWGAWLALRNKKTLVMSPHGALIPLQLQHSVWKKRLVGWMDRWLLRRASVVHVTCEAENAWVRKFLEPQNPQKCTKKIVVISNGIEEVH